MNKVTKLLILIVLSCSVYFIYNQTKNSLLNITNMGDSFSVGINSYGVKESSYVDYYVEHLLRNNQKVNISTEFSKKDLSISTLLEQVKNNPIIKKVLTETDILFLTVGYNDYVYKLSLIENINMETLDRTIKDISLEYNELITEIQKYYKRKIVVIGYYASTKKDYYFNKGLRKLNEALSTCSEDIEYIDTYELLSNRNKFFSNPKLNYPNSLGYQEISKKIIEKRLEKSKNIWYINNAFNYYGN